jgi:hypothetical protein
MKSFFNITLNTGHFPSHFSLFQQREVLSSRCATGGKLQA